jgi:hypothetical protein
MIGPFEKSAVFCVLSGRARDGIFHAHLTGVLRNNSARRVLLSANPSYTARLRVQDGPLPPFTPVARLYGWPWLLTRVDTVR